MTENPMASVPIFPERRKGYDPIAVDQYLHGLQRQLAQAQTQAAEATQQLRANVPSVVGDATTEAARTLQAARETAERALGQARHKAKKQLSESKRRAQLIAVEADKRAEAARGMTAQAKQMHTDADEVLATAQTKSDEVMATANANAASINGQATAGLEQTRVEAGELLRNAEQVAITEGEKVRATADYDAERIRHHARDDAKSIRDEANAKSAKSKEAAKATEEQLIVAAKEHAARLVAEAESDADTNRQVAEATARTLIDTATGRAEALERSSQEAAARTRAEAREQAIEVGREATAEMEILLSEFETQHTEVEQEVKIAKEQLAQIDGIAAARRAQLADDVDSHRRMVSRYASTARRELNELDQRLAELGDSVIDLNAVDTDVSIETAYESLS